MKKNYRRFIVTIFCICLALFLSACGGNSTPETVETEETEVNTIELADTAWESEGATLQFHTDGSVEISNGDNSIIGEYEWYGDEGVVSYDGTDIYLLLDETGDLYMTDGEISYLMTYIGIAGGDHEGTYIPGNSSLVGRHYEELDDSRMYYMDYDSNIAVIFPNNMGCIENYIGGAATISDAMGGYVIGQNITDSYNSSSLSDEDFINEYISSYVTVAYILLYESDYEFDVDIIYEDFSIVAAEGNIYSDSYDIYYRTIIYNSGEDIVVKTMFADWDDYYYSESDQFYRLYDEVVVLVPAI